MEYKIGQIFEIDGIWYQFVEDNSYGCGSCVFSRFNGECANPEEDVKCAKFIREDGKSGHFVRLLPIGDVYEQGGVKWQQYKCVEKPNTEDKRVYIAYTDSEVGLIVSIRLTSSNDMENNEKHSNSENIGKKLKPFKPFDLQAAKSGKPVCTRSGKPVRIICFDVKGAKHPIIALVKEDEYERVCSYMPDGRRFNDEEEWPDDLMMLPEKKEGWAVIRRSDIYKNEEQAKEALLNSHTAMMVRKITWEE